MARMGGRARAAKYTPQQLAEFSKNAGRPAKLDGRAKRRLRTMLAAGRTQAECAAELGISIRTVGRAVAKALNSENRVASMREYFYFDTNVYRDIIEENRRSDESLLRRHKKRLKLSATTVLELLEDLDSRPATEFATAHRVLNLARDTAGHGILPIREEFMARRLFKTGYRSDHVGSNQLRLWLEVAVRYKSKDELGKLVRVGAAKVPMALQTGDIRKAEERFRAIHVDMVKGYVKEIVKEAGLQSFPSIGGPLSRRDAALLTGYFQSKSWKRHYVRMWAEALGRRGLPEGQLDELWPAMQPASEFLSTVLLQSLRDAYNFEKNANDITDEAQLSYLSNPSLVFVTQDKRLRSKLSPQSLLRVITFEEFKHRSVTC